MERKLHGTIVNTVSGKSSGNKTFQIEAGTGTTKEGDTKTYVRLQNVSGNNIRINALTYQSDGIGKYNGFALELNGEEELENLIALLEWTASKLRTSSGLGSIDLSTKIVRSGEE